MNKKSKMITAVMLLAVSAAGLVLINYYNPQQEQEHQELETPPGNPMEQAIDSCENFTDIEKAKCYLDKDDLNASLEVCENLSGGDENICYQRIALDITNKNISNLNKSIELCNRVTGGKFYCYTNLASTVVKSDMDAAVFLCNLTSPPDICYTTIGRVLSHQDIDLALEMCNTSKAAACYDSVAEVVMKEDMEKAIYICGIVGSEKCYSSAASYIAEEDTEKAASICNEYINFCSGRICGCPHCCHIDAAEKIAGENTGGAINICENLSGVNKAHCYYGIISYINETEDIERLCSYMTDIWGEHPMVMRYCKDS